VAVAVEAAVVVAEAALAALPYTPNIL